MQSGSGKRPSVAEYVVCATACGALSDVVFSVDVYGLVALNFNGACEVVGVQLAVEVGGEKYSSKACGRCGGVGESLWLDSGGFCKYASLRGTADAVGVPYADCGECDFDGVGGYALVVDSGT